MTRYDEDIEDIEYDEDIEEEVGFGPEHPPVLQGIGFDAPNFPLPAVAQERNALAARYAAVCKRVDEWRLTVEEAEVLVDQARTVSAEVDAFVAAHDADGALNLRTLMRATGSAWVIGRAVSHKTEAIKREAARKADEVHKALTSEWRASGGSWKPAGDRITFQGREYVLGPVGSQWVARSNMTYMGESVDGNVVSSRSLICPDTGAAILRWDSRWAYPA